MNYLDCVIVAQRRQAATHPLPQQRNWSPDPKGAKQRTGKQAKGGGPRHTPPHATCDTATHPPPYPLLPNIPPVCAWLGWVPRVALLRWG